MNEYENFQSSDQTDQKEETHSEDRSEDIKDTIEDEETEQTDDSSSSRENNAETEEEEEKGELSEKINTFIKENEQLKQENEQLKDRLLRSQAEFDNFRKRTEKERSAMRKYEAEAVATDLLEVIDNFERALETEVSEENKGFHEGVEMVYKQFLQVLHSHGVEALETVGESFDPNKHHAVMQVDDDSYESNIVTEELQKGYVLKDKVIRPAMVKVNK